MHGHSHFAFSAWVSQAILLGFIWVLYQIHQDDKLPKKYQYILLINTFLSYGILFAFTVQGYALYSIILSTCYIIFTYIFSWIIWLDIKKATLSKSLKIQFFSALIFNVISSIGTFYLVYLRVLDQLTVWNQLASVYFYLHFQYNGWFFFGCLGLFNAWVEKKTGIIVGHTKFWLAYVFTVIPAFLLSILWWKGFPNWLYFLVIATVLVQLIFWIKVCLSWKHIISLMKLRSFNSNTKLYWICSFWAVGLKLLLQGFSVIPALSNLAYGFRPIVIAYLHLVLLVIISLFLIGFLLQVQGLRTAKSRIITCLLIFGIFLNEFILMLQGMAGLFRFSVPGTHQLLLLAASIISISLIAFVINQRIVK